MNSDSWYNCEHPHLVRNRYTGDLVQVTCGHCTACKSRKMQRWISPLYREASCWKYSFFVTLTYEDRFLPKLNLKNHYVEPQFKKNFDDLCKQSEQFISFHRGWLPYCPSKDIQLFNKRLSQNIFRSTGKRSQYRYFFSSDYGSTCFRPHWHGIIFTNNQYVASNITALIVQAWSLFNKASGKRYQLGRIECEPAYAAARYVSAYLQAIDDLPAIYSFRDFKTKSFHSSHPSIGSLVKSVESPEQIVRNGLTKITVFDPVSFQWSKIPLEPSIIYNLFPKIPSYSSLQRDERLEIYRIMYDVIDLVPVERRLALFDTFYWNSFFRDYITLNDDSLTPVQLIDKFDRVFYAFKRLYLQSQAYGMSVSEYDELIFQYQKNRYYESLVKQFEFEDNFMIKHGDEEKLKNIIDIAYNDNLRNIDSFSDRPFHLPVSARSVQPDYFRHADVTHSRLIKRKCDNAYLDLHPEFKQFHT